ncbi:MAG: hypothetical protein IBX50_09605 [Marinospirillum sp.]|uniref:hypothetical protein n=1 Tax=Marinospirillum sp. TaxID=2183934 RepID=UPI0019F2FE93|nr:hypothetical protein [Marinospirillum sp.]MBE0506957.1 hypothetical protein [Marinospirillum sp.]
MGRPNKKVTVSELAWITEYLVGRVNRAEYKLQMFRADKRNPNNAENPKAVVYRLAADVVELVAMPKLRQEQQWLDLLSRVLERVNTWINTYLNPGDRNRMWTAYRVAKKGGFDPYDLMLFETYEMVMSELQPQPLEPEEQ